MGVHTKDWYIETDPITSISELGLKVLLCLEHGVQPSCVIVVIETQLVAPGCLALDTIEVVEEEFPCLTKHSGGGIPSARFFEEEPELVLSLNRRDELTVFVDVLVSS